ncbi:immunoglobulin domain protein [Ancylostoma caninum]|uniref:Immunoglobulin domain protein n=1 Tax=Ancylostoma caninum TaxID=29170 RepID=A0A368HBD8_ANCCA|nr:immunoglobulin domain protein [Ancylostoma caninum]
MNEPGIITKRLPRKVLIELLWLRWGQQDYAYDDGDADDEDRNPVKVASKHLDPENTLILRQGKPLMVECVYGREDIADISDLQWQKKGAKVIDGSSSSSIFTTGLLEHGTRHKKKNLHFTAIHKRDEGTYECRARSLGGKTYSREVKVVVLNEIRWNDESHSAGALLGEPLTIDCGVNGDDDEHQITITDSEGETLDANMYTIAGKEVTVEHLTKEYDGKKISCVHIESYGKDELPIIDRREVNIDVWYKPEFEKDSVDQYTIVDGKPREVELSCPVAASNPPAILFTFYRDGNELNDPEKYNLTIDKRHKKATLKIFNINEDDLDEYRCEVNNGKAKSTMTIHLKETSPPSEPKVTLHKVKEHSITWKIENKEEEGELPIKEIEIDYLRKSVVDEKLEENADSISDSFWNDHGIKHKRSKSPSGLYEITGLLQASEYVFKIRQFSEAGEGPSVILRATTHEDTDLKQELSSSRSYSWFSALTTLLITLLFSLRH